MHKKIKTELTDLEGRINVLCPKWLAIAVRVEAAKRDLSLRTLVVEAVRSHLNLNPPAERTDRRQENKRG